MLHQNEICSIHNKIADEKDIAKRMRIVAETLEGRPYLSNPLNGGPDQSEKFVADLSAFDCVTFVETTLALARSKTKTGFLSELKNLRYKKGSIDWFNRLHYFYDWMQNNEKRNALKICTPGIGAKRISKTLGFIEQLPMRKVAFHVVPKQKIDAAFKRIPDGTIVAFASVRSRLDFFHVGLLFWDTSSKKGKEELMLFHASRGAGKVLYEPLSAFLKRNRFRGVALAAPRG